MSKNDIFEHVLYFHLHIRSDVHGDELFGRPHFEQLFYSVEIGHEGSRLVDQVMPKMQKFGNVADGDEEADQVAADRHDFGELGPQSPDQKRNLLLHQRLVGGVTIMVL